MVGPELERRGGYPVDERSLHGHDSGLAYPQPGSEQQREVALANQAGALYSLLDTDDAYTILLRNKNSSKRGSRKNPVWCVDWPRARPGLTGMKPLNPLRRQPCRTHLSGPPPV